MNTKAAANKDYEYVVKNGTVEILAYKGTKTTVTIPSTVVIKGKSYRVTAIHNKAFANCKQLKAVLIPAAVRRIGKGAFYKCKRLRKIYVRTQLLTKASIGKGAFKKIHKKARFYVPRARKNYYRKLFRKRGATKKMKFKRL